MECFCTKVSLINHLLTKSYKISQKLTSISNLILHWHLGSSLEAEVLKCLACDETEAGCNEAEAGEDIKVVECQMSDPDGPNYGNSCLVGHTGIQSLVLRCTNTDIHLKMDNI